MFYFLCFFVSVGPVYIDGAWSGETFTILFQPALTISPIDLIRWNIQVLQNKGRKRVSRRLKWLEATVDETGTILSTKKEKKKKGVLTSRRQKKPEFLGSC